MTAWRALVVDGKLKAGDRVLLLGTGGVSIWTLQLAKMLAASVAIPSSSGEKQDRARDLGADFVVNYREEPEWGKRGEEQYARQVHRRIPAKSSSSLAACGLRC